MDFPLVIIYISRLDDVSDHDEFRRKYGFQIYHCSINGGLYLYLSNRQYNQLKHDRNIARFRYWKTHCDIFSFLREIPHNLYQN